MNTLLLCVIDDIVPLYTIVYPYRGVIVYCGSDLHTLS